MRIGNENVFEVQCVVHAKSIGNNNSIQAQADLKQGAQIGKNLYKLKKITKTVVLQKVNKSTVILNFQQTAARSDHAAWFSKTTCCRTARSSTEATTSAASPTKTLRYGFKTVWDIWNLFSTRIYEVPSHFQSSLDDCETLRKILPTYHKMHQPNA